MTDPSPLAQILAALGRAVVDDEAAETWRAEQATAQADIDRAQRLAALHRAGVPVVGAIEAALADGGATLRRTKPLDVMRRWLASNDVPPILVLSGGTGSGKSVAAAYAVAQLRGGLWYSAPQIARIFAASFGDQYDEQRKVHDAALLVVDDVGTETKIGTALIEILESRKRSARIMRTIISTNLNAQEFARRYPDPRIASRMLPTAGAVAWLDCPGVDMRRTAP